jgi:hypothetical protein
VTTHANGIHILVCAEASKQDWGWEEWEISAFKEMNP